MTYPIVIYGSSVLRAECEEITPDYPELKKLVSDMFDTMYAADGVGLAAPQIGKDVRLFVVDASGAADEYPELKDFKRAFINPEIYAVTEEEELFTEGCLSIPGLHEDVLRPVGIKMRYLDENFVEQDEVFDGYPARIIQHEYDHLDGKLFTDHLQPLRKTLLKSKLAAMAKGKYKAFYKTKITK